MRWFKTKNSQRRTQNLTTNKQAFSYYSGGRQVDNPNDSRVKPGMFLRLLKHSPSLLALAAILYGIGNLLTLSPDPNVVVLRSNSQNTFIRPDQEYQNAAAQILSRSIFNRSKITINSSNLINKIQEKFPEIDSVSISLPFLRRRPVINVHPAPLVLLLETQGQSLIINQDGRALMDASSSIDLKKLNLPRVKDESGLEIKVGQQVLNVSNTKFISEVIGQLSSKKLQIESIVLPPLPEELHVKLSGKKYYIKFDLRSDPKVAVGTLQATIAKFEADHIMPGDYIDVRVEGKAFYK